MFLFIKKIFQLCHASFYTKNLHSTRKQCITFDQIQYSLINPYFMKINNLRSGMKSQKFRHKHGPTSASQTTIVQIAETPKDSKLDKISIGLVTSLPNGLNLLSMVGTMKSQITTPHMLTLFCKYQITRLVRKNHRFKKN